MSDAVRVAHMDELERIEAAGVVYMPIRRRLGVRAFGINAYTAANAGDQVIERHNETGAGAGAHEELYLVISGRAEFTVAGEAVDAPAGTLVFVPDLASERAAIAREPDTTVLVIGAPAAAPLPTSPFEYWFAAEPAYRSGDYDGAVGDRVGGAARVARPPGHQLPAGLLPRPGGPARRGARTPRHRGRRGAPHRRVGGGGRRLRLDPRRSRLSAAPVTAGGCA